MGNLNASTLIRFFGSCGAEADFDGDGRAELAIATTSGSVELARTLPPSQSFHARAVGGVKNLKLSSGV